MSVKYRLVASRNPQTREDGFRAQAVWTVAADEELIERLADETSVGPGDIASVLKRLSKVLRMELKAGRAVRFEGIGTFYVSVLSKLVPQPEAFVPPTHLQGGRIRFRPEPLLRATEATLTFAMDGPRPEGDGTAAPDAAEPREG